MNHYLIYYMHKFKNLFFFLILNILLIIKKLKKNKKNLFKKYFQNKFLMFICY